MTETAEMLSSPDYRTVLLLPKGDARHIVFPLVQELKNRHGSRIIVVVKGKEEQKHFEQTGWTDHVYCMSSIASRDPVDEDAAIARARQIETEMGLCINDLMIPMRLFYTASINFPSNAMMPYAAERREYKHYLDWVIRQCDFFRDIIRRHQVTLALNLPPIGAAVAQAEGVPFRTFSANLFESHYCWFRDRFADLPELEGLYRQSMTSTHEPPERPLVQPFEYLNLRSSMLRNFSWGRVLHGAAIELVREAYYRWRGYDKAVVFGMSGWRWLKYLIAQKVAFDRLVAMAPAKLTDFRHKPFIFYPLSSEPEATLAFWSPEFYDQMSIIHAVAKNLPAGCFLAVKEHISCIGNRPAQFYETIAAMPNVILVDPREKGLEIVKASRAVATVASTAGFEAMVDGIPVLSFGAHTYYRFLPHVELVSDFLKVRAAVTKVLAYSDDDRAEFRRHARHLLHALGKISLDLETLSNATPDERAVALADSLAASFTPVAEVTP